MKKYILRSISILFFSVFFLVVLSFLQELSFISPIRSACAANWGACNSDPNYQVCPKTHAAPDHCVTSSDFNVTINGTGIPIGQKFTISIFPDDNSLSCADVNCLERSTTYTTPDGWDGNPYHVTLDQIGCSAGNCANKYTVRVRFATDPGINCPNPDDFHVAAIQNGVANFPSFNIACETPPVTCTTTATQQCQQENTITGCLAGWTKDTTKTCTTPAVCCTQTACVKPAIPKPTITCSGCN